jgi:uncharacterized protein involved in tellurium resistance
MTIGTFIYDGAGTITATDGTNTVVIYSNSDTVLAQRTFNELRRVATMLGVAVA